MSKKGATAASKVATAEETAVKVVAALLTADHDERVTFEHWDVPPRQGAHDFWICRGEAREALEITTLADQDSKRNAAHWCKRGPGYATTIDNLTVIRNTTEPDQGETGPHAEGAPLLPEGHPS
ncbi:hypothetical protein [Streptomyces olindensis]|uniref:hypothetical protein n=1 Tax=Streptomyces olindensis TaxID=358823 RepID=UPI0033E2FB92